MKRLIMLLLTVASLSVNGQKLYKCDTTRSFLTFAFGNSFYSVKLLGNATETERTNVISFNNSVLQSLIVDKVKFVKEGEDNADLKILIRHATSEAEHLSNLFKTKINIQLQQSSFSKTTVLFWFYEMPPGHNQEVKSQLFTNIIIDDKIFGLASPQFADQEFKKVFDSLMDVISTIKKAGSKSDFDKLCGK